MAIIQERPLLARVSYLQYVKGRTYTILWLIVVDEFVGNDKVTKRNEKTGKRHGQRVKQMAFHLV